MQTLTDWATYDCLAVGSGITEVYLDNNDDESYNDNTNMHISIPCLQRDAMLALHALY